MNLVESDKGMAVLEKYGFESPKTPETPKTTNTNATVTATATKATA
jgi:hypothetical protein